MRGARDRWKLRTCDTGSQCYGYCLMGLDDRRDSRVGLATPGMIKLFSRNLTSTQERDHLILRLLDYFLLSIFQHLRPNRHSYSERHIPAVNQVVGQEIVSGAEDVIDSPGLVTGSR